MSLTTTPDEPRVHGPFDAIGARGGRSGRRLEFGLYAHDGEPLPHCDVAGDLFTSAPRAAAPDAEPLVTYDAPLLFAGMVPQQFGHVILNSLGRLWALDDLPPEAGLLYLPRHQPRLRHYRHLVPLLRLLNASTKIVLHRHDARYPELYTADDLFGERHGGAMHDRMRHWLAQRLPPAGAVTKGRKVYLTRSQLGWHVGRFCNETLLENLLRADGYEIVAPERLSLQSQVALMQDAQTLLFSESSALHLYGLVQRPGQRVGVIQRRHDLPELIRGQLGGGAGSYSEINAISELYWPPRRRDNISLAVLDFDQLRRALVKRRFLTAKAAWRAPSDAEVAASLFAGLAPGARIIPDQERITWLNTRRQQQWA